MSLLSPERVVVGLAPEKLSALALTGRLQPRLSDRHVLPLPEQPASEWDKSIAALDTLLTESDWHGRDITVVLSGHYVRHAVVPAERGLSDAELLTLAGIVFRDVFGELASDWELRVSPPGAAATTLASGVPRQLLASLTAVCEAQGRLRSIQTGLMAVFNRARRDIGASTACLAVVETGRVTVATIDHGRWLYVDSRAGGPNILPQLLLEESQLHARQPGGILWLCDLTGMVALPPNPYWSQRHIDPPQVGGIDDGLEQAAGLATNLALWGVA